MGVTGDFMRFLDVEPLGRYLPRILEEWPHATVPRAVPENAPLDHPHLYFNRELSALDFNWRVLFQALDGRNPLLERVRFLAIAYANLDEFFRKRVGGLKRQEAAGVRILSPDGRTPAEQLRLIRSAAELLYGVMIEAWENVLKPRLAERAEVFIHSYNDLTPSQRVQADTFFQRYIYPVLTPLAVDPGHPFPFISNLSLSLAVMLRHPEHKTEHFARVKVPTRYRWIVLDEPYHFIPAEEVIREHIEDLFKGMEVLDVHAFRVTRNADIQRNEEVAEDLLAMIAEEIRERRFAPVVRLEIEAGMPAPVQQLLMEALELSSEDVYVAEGMLGLDDCRMIADLDISEHRFPPWEPVIPPRLRVAMDEEGHADIFSVIRQGDFLVHHPYESFTATVQRFIEEAARDPQVVAIKQTLYRTSENSPIAQALALAAESGKQVAVLVEVKARFDEESNMEWGQYLERAGVHVTYGLIGLKTHAKVALVIREEEDGLRPYVHIGTGNYNNVTARLYTDIGLFTCRSDIGRDVINLFHFLTGYAPEQSYEKLIVAPRDMRPRFEALIQREIQHVREGKKGHIIAKMNGLDDVQIIQQLYAVAQAGVQIDLIVRGHCRLRPGLAGYSSNIRVRSIIWRFLEHSRIYYFYNDGASEVFIGSADWQRRNLDDRVEAIAPVEAPELRRYLEWVLQLALTDNRLAWELFPEGTYRLRTPSPGEPERNFQVQLMQWARKRDFV